MPGCMLLYSGFTEHIEEHVAMDRDFLAADWLQELPEDLDMFIAQRNFEGAVDQVEKGGYFWHCCGSMLHEYCLPR